MNLLVLGSSVQFLSESELESLFFFSSFWTCGCWACGLPWPLLTNPWIADLGGAGARSPLFLAAWFSSWISWELCWLNELFKLLCLCTLLLWEITLSRLAYWSFSRWSCWLNALILTKSLRDLFSLPLLMSLRSTLWLMLLLTWLIKLPLDTDPLL